jgi:hypothetical protein
MSVFMKLAIWGERLAVALLALAVIAPAFPGMQLPRIYGGDEPHYLVILSSLVQDGDVDLRNNYESVHRGGLDAGARWAKLKKLDDQTVFFANGIWKFWFQTYETARWGMDDTTGAVPVLRKGTPAIVQGTPEYSIHQIGFAWLLAPFVFWARGTEWFEAAAILTATLATVLGMLAYRDLLRVFSPRPWAGLAVTAAVFLGTPVWAYGRSFFMEPYLLALAVGSYALVLSDRAPLLPGILLGIAMQLKPHFGLLAVPLLAYYALRKDWRSALWLAIPLAVSVLIILGTYWAMFGSPLQSPQSFHYGDILTGLKGLLVSPKAGMFVFAPVAFAALACWPLFLKRHGPKAWVVLGGFLPYFLFMAAYAYWDGGYSFGPRYLVPILPFFLMPLLELFHRKRYLKPWILIPVLALCLWGIRLNALEAFHYGEYWGMSMLPGAN